MINGIVYKDPARHVQENKISPILKSPEHSAKAGHNYCYRNSGFVWHNDFVGECQFLMDRSHGLSVAFQGRIFNFDELRKRVDQKERSDSVAQLIVFLYLKYGEKFVKELRGKFAFAIYNHQ